MDKSNLQAAIEKLLNSKIVIKNYPMVEFINIDEFHDDGMLIDIVVNDEEMTADNMYYKEFDPHWLVDNYIKSALKYLGVKFKYVAFKVHTTSGKLVYHWLLD
jgi:hypothetical protein